MSSGSRDWKPIGLVGFHRSNAGKLLGKDGGTPGREHKKMWPVALESMLGVLGLKILLIENDAATARTLALRAPLDHRQQRFGNVCRTSVTLCLLLLSPRRRHLLRLLPAPRRDVAANTASRVVLSSFPSLQTRPSKGQAGQTLLLGAFSPRRKSQPTQPDELLLFQGSASLCLPSHRPDPRALLPRPHSATNGPGAAPAARDRPSENPGRRSWTPSVALTRPGDR
jgi:hypothetical protein